jgi:hypothetical protein
MQVVEIHKIMTAWPDWHAMPSLQIMQESMNAYPAKDAGFCPFDWHMARQTGG